MASIKTSAVVGLIIAQNDAAGLLKHLEDSLSNKENEQQLGDYLETISMDDVKKLWSIVESVLEEIAQQPTTTDTTSTSSSDVDEVDHKLKVLHTCSQTAALFSKKSKHRCQSLWQCVHSLCSHLDALSTDRPFESSVKNSISLLCEQWFLRKESNANALLPQTLTYLLMETLKPASKDALVKRLCTLRSGLHELDLPSAGADFSKNLLLRCFLHPSLLKSAEGVKFLSFLLSVSDGFLLDSAFDVIKAQAATGAKSVVSIYGEIIQKTWKDLSTTANTSHQESNHIAGNAKKSKTSSSSSVIALCTAGNSISNSNNNNSTVQVALEDAVQELIHIAAHCPDAKYFRGLRFLLKSFHDVTRSDACEEMLVRIFDPILWRSLRCANATVRAQTAVLFFDVFPLQRVNAKSAEDCDQLLQKQFDQLVALLKDGDHRVRATAVSGVFHILREYWDILPGATVQNILRFIFETLAFDVSSAAVRCCVITGIDELLQQPLAHPALKALLPLLGNLIHDKTEKNRLAFVKLLNSVKTVRDIHFYDIVSVPHLLQRVASDRDHKDISHAMCALLLDSFYPNNNKTQNKTAAGKELVHRCFQFVEESPLAAEAFYGSLHSQVAIGSVTKLAVMLFHVLNNNLSARLSTVNRKPTGGKRRRGAVLAAQQQGAKETELAAKAQENEDEFDHLNDAIVAGVARVVFALLASIDDKLDGETHCLQLLFQFFSPSKVMQFFESMLTLFGTQLDLISVVIRLVQCVLKIARKMDMPDVDFGSFHDTFGVTPLCCDMAPLLMQETDNVALQKDTLRSVVGIVLSMDSLVGLHCSTLFYTVLSF
jgi:condensin-2 complex subunit G2